MAVSVTVSDGGGSCQVMLPLSVTYSLIQERLIRKHQSHAFAEIKLIFSTITVQKLAKTKYDASLIKTANHTTCGSKKRQGPYKNTNEG